MRQVLSSNVSLLHSLFKLFHDISMQFVAEIFDRSPVKFQHNWSIIIRQLTLRLCVPAIKPTSHLFTTAYQVRQLSAH